ncbi:MAG: DNA mismatch repair protein MutS [Methyloprofundus sp.]|nr:DNA mismatch repair protein MutS [Methyloprofundus sp.]MDT8426878.1 DNA mismatch repair protein MutS [Methyloprofundus sp.]
MTILKAWNEQWPKIKVSQPAATGEGVLDIGAFKSIEVDSVFNTINYAQTTIGQAVLYRSLARPLDNLQAIADKQKALKEIQVNPELKATLARLVENAKKDEKSFHQLLFAKFLGSGGTARNDAEIEGYGYTQYRRGTRFILAFVAGLLRLEKPKSAYLDALINDVRAFTQTRAYSLMSGPAYITEKGIQSKIDRKNLSPAIIFKPHIFKPLLIGLVLATLIGVNLFVPIGLLSFSPMFAIFLAPLALVYFPLIGGFDRDSCIKPLREEYRQSDDVAKVLEVLGSVDELLSLVQYAESNPGAMVLPELIVAKHHKINLKNAKNPVLSKVDATYVGNDFSIDTEKLVLITGPNSGGKTAFCKTLTQIQLLAQIGSYVPAAQATLTVADRIFYQVPEISQLDDGEGRFGTELKRTKDIFLASTAKSLVVLDELSEGTTFEEKMETSANVLNGFYQKGNNTILITHNHQLVDHFLAEHKGVALQVQFVGEDPTHKLILGISRVSHAHRVAKKIGFSKEDIAGYLADN